MEVLKICGALLVCTLSASLLKRLGTPVYLAVVISGALAAVAFMLPKLSEIVSTALDGADLGDVPYISTVFKVTGAALVCEAACDIAEASGESGLSKALGAAGKIEIVYLSLPLLRDLIESAKEIASSSLKR